MKYLAPIDPHVHLRWNEYPDTPYLEWGLADAHAVGLAAVIEMPNTSPTLTNEYDIQRRVATVDTLLRKPVHSTPRHFMQAGTTNQIFQLNDMFRDHSLLRHTYRVVGMKLYCCHSTGDMGVLEYHHQRNIFQAAREGNYKGPISVHCEDPRLFELTFDPKDPITHSRRQYGNAEIASVKKTIELAAEAGFEGKLVLVHISTAGAVEYAKKMEKDVPFELRTEVSWHHLFLNTDDYASQGNRVKMNPPLRHPAAQAELLRLFLTGQIDMIGTDHAPHPVQSKDSDKPPSGIPAIPFWPRGIEILRDHGISDYLLRKTTFENANDIFNLRIPAREVDVTYDPSLWDKYGWNPFKRLG